MKFIRYRRYSGDPAAELDLPELMSRLADHFLDSGFHSAYHQISELDLERTRAALRAAILRALENGDLLPEELKQELERDPRPEDNAKLRSFLDDLISRMIEEGYLAPEYPQVTPPPEQTPGGRVREDFGRRIEARLELTGRAIDFLGFKTLKELLGALGRSSFGRHDTRDLATGVESGGVSRAYEFGDTLNLDISATLHRAIRRRGTAMPVELDYPDLTVHQCEYQSSCATVLLLDCSHSMILYGEDRFTPAKRVALALSHLIRTQYPADSLHVVIFHDTAEEVPLAHLARVRVGPYYTNTREGLRMARRILLRQKTDMRQIVLITDGKPSALTLEDGRIYKNAFGLDPLVVAETMREVARCRQANILINTFMLASDYPFVHFVQKVTELCRGKAYFASPHNLGQYLLLDYLRKKTRRIH